MNMMPISEVYNIDCMEGLREMPDNFYKLALLDPPYGIGMHVSAGAGTIGFRVEKNGKKSLIKRQPKNIKEWDKEPPTKEYFNEIFRVSQHQIIWGANHFIDLMPYRSPSWIVWDKKNGNTNQSDCELAWTSFNRAVRKFEYMWSGMIQQQQNKSFVEKRIHPTQKPVALYEWLLKNYAQKGDNILDTHMGSQSSRIAAYKLGFDFTGYEIDADYFKEGNERFKDAVSMPLFDVPVFVPQQLVLV